MDVFEPIRKDSRLEELTRLLERCRGPVAAEGLWGSSAPIVAGLAAERLGRPLLLVTAHSDEADDIRDDIETALGSAPELLPQLDTLPNEAVGADELAGERLRLCLFLLRQGSVGTWGRGEVGTEEGADGSSRPHVPTSPLPHAPPVIVAPIMALMQPVPSAEAIRASSFAISAGDTLDPEVLARWLSEHGFQRCDAVEVPGDFARRGGIVDVYSNAHTDPIRIEFFGDDVESIRLFDTGTQRSSHTLDGIQVPALSFGDRKTGTLQAGERETRSFLALLPPTTIIAFNEPSEVQELGRTYLQRLGERVGIIPADAIFRRANDFTQLHLQRFTGGADDAVRFDVSSLPQFEPKSTDALKALGELAQAVDVVVLCDNRPEEQRFHELLDQQPERPERVQTTIGVIQRGFSMGTDGLCPAPRAVPALPPAPHAPPCAAGSADRQLL